MFPDERRRKYVVVIGYTKMSVLMVCVKLCQIVNMEESDNYCKLEIRSHNQTSVVNLINFNCDKPSAEIKSIPMFELSFYLQFQLYPYVKSCIPSVRE